MRRRRFLHAALAACVVTGGLCGPPGGEARSDEARRFERVVAPVLQTHCVMCHGDGSDAEGEVNLADLTGDRLTADPELLRRMIGVLDRGEMPPEGEPQPGGELREQLVGELRSLLRNSVAQSGESAQTPIRRMTRFQYNNAVTDLFDLRCNVFTLPERIIRDHQGYFQPETGKMPEVVHVGNRPLGKSQLIEPRLAGVAAFPQDRRAEHGFDNRGDHLSLSPLLMDAFLRLSQSITQSPDFVPDNVGIWDAFFAPSGEGIDSEEVIRRRLEPFLFRAFRRPVEDAVLDRYVAYASKRLDAGVDFTEAMKEVAAATIASPRFLYLYETEASAEGPAAVDDFDLASRLSFFLWGSLPDQTLLELARAGRLSQPDVLDAQLQRMLRDRKLKRFCDSFPTQWLQLDRLISSVPNRERFPEFYFSKYRGSMHMMLEPLLIFETVLIENQPMTQLIDSDFTYRSAHLEETYGDLATPAELRPEGRTGRVTVLSFHRVPVTDRRNGGVITNAAVMTMTSGPERTKPITRGGWIASVIFNTPPKPPPADVPPLAETPSADEEHLTLRERLALHRERADCRGCHEKIDPLGFALENYNPIGRWRVSDTSGRDIDVSGNLFRRHAFASVVEFKDALLAEKDLFTRALAGHLLSFALARDLTAADQMALDRIVEATAANEYRMHTLLREVVLCDPFQGRTLTSARHAAR